MQNLISDPVAWLLKVVNSKPIFHYSIIFLFLTLVHHLSSLSLPSPPFRDPSSSWSSHNSIFDPLSPFGYEDYSTSVFWEITESIVLLVTTETFSSKRPDQSCQRPKLTELFFCRLFSTSSYSTNINKTDVHKIKKLVHPSFSKGGTIVDP